MEIIGKTKAIHCFCSKNFSCSDFEDKNESSSLDKTIGAFLNENSAQENLEIPRKQKSAFVCYCPILEEVKLDTDWYESTKHELIHLFPRLVVGGILIIDDYGHWEGCRKAVDEYFAEHKTQIFLSRIDYTGRIAVKTQAWHGDTL